MQESSLELLEYGALKALIGRQVSSTPARRLLDELEPSSDQSALEATHSETAEAITLLDEAAGQKGVSIRFTGLPEIDMAAARIGIEGASLDGRELYDVLQWLDRAGELRTTLSQISERYPLLAARAKSLADLRSVLREIAGKVLPDGSLADHASVALERIRRGIDRQRDLIQHSLEKFMRQHRDDGVLQDEFVTIRNERFVIPLVAGMRGRVPGVIHAASGTGATLFVEPMETIALNNDLVRLTEEEMRETHRILLQLTATLREHSAAIRSTIAAMALLELTFAKGWFARDFKCVTPKFGDRLHLDAARHPLLEDVLRKENKRVVPVSFTIDRIHRTLLITGPNTGGKTVTMKTAGLLALMAQSGIPVPCREAEFPIFDQVLADIGDNQSIAESLSSFSSHVRTISNMLRAVTPDSLVLLDELGRATDPEEGGALGVAVLEKFREYGAFTIASTHLMPLKVWGATKDGVVQASMGFNEEEFTPTYLLVTGAPGRSAGLAIASKLGLPKSLIERARQAMSTSERDIASFLGELHRRLAEVKEKQRAMAEERVRFERELAKERDQLRKEHDAKVRELERRTATAIAQFEERAKVTIDEMAQAASTRKSVEQATRKVAQATSALRNDVDVAVRPAVSAAAGPGVEQPRLAEGMRVKLRGVREAARIRRLLSGGEIEVEAGFLKMRVPAGDVIEVLPENAPAAAGGSKLPQGITFSQGPSWDTVTREVNVIGQRAEEARETVEKFLDTASLASVDRVRIVHGHGMGVLKRTVADLLKNSPHVARHYAASPAEGGNGATIAELR